MNFHNTENEQTMNEVITIEQAVLALAAGKEIQYRIKGGENWYDLPANGQQLSNYTNYDFSFRVKPEEAK